MLSLNAKGLTAPEKTINDPDSWVILETTKTGVHVHFTASQTSLEASLRLAGAKDTLQASSCHKSCLLC